MPEPARLQLEPLSWSAGVALAMEEASAHEATDANGRGSSHQGGASMLKSACGNTFAAATTGKAGGGVGVVVATSDVPTPLTPSLPLVASRDATVLCPPRITAWLHNGRPATALVALAMSGWPRGWNDGLLAHALHRHARRLQLPQWTPLLILCHQMDSRRAAAKEQRRRTSGATAATDDGSGDGVAALAPQPLGPCATLLLLRAMLTAQPPAVCLGVLRAQPSLAACLPPCGYVELLHAVQRANAASGEASEPT